MIIVLETQKNRNFDNTMYIKRIDVFVLSKYVIQLSLRLSMNSYEPELICLVYWEWEKRSQKEEGAWRNHTTEVCLSESSFAEVLIPYIGKCEIFHYQTVRGYKF